MCHNGGRRRRVRHIIILYYIIQCDYVMAAFGRQEIEMRTTYERDSYRETTITHIIITLVLQTSKLYGTVVHADNYNRVFNIIHERYYYCYYYELCLCRVRPCAYRGDIGAAGRK